MSEESYLTCLLSLGLFIGVALNVWLFLTSDDESSNDFN